jgi:UDP-N-acetylglucosamine 3-dehydrogenase
VIKAAVIGVGSMGSNHVRVYAEMREVDLVAVADPHEEARRRVARTYRVKSYRDYRSMLDQEKPELVSIAVPTAYHAEVACEAISRGAHVLIEKPLALTQAEGQQVIDLAVSEGVKLTVGHIERFNPAIVEIKEKLDKQELGRVFQIHARRLTPFPGHVQDVGVVLDLATHDIDVMRYLLSAEAERIYAEIERKAHTNHEDLLSGLLRFSDGVIGVLDVNWLTPTTVRQLTVLGEGGIYLADYLTQDVFWYKNSGVPTVWDALHAFPGVWEGDMIKVHFQKKEPLQAELESFVATVLADREPQVSGEDALAALDLAQRLVESGRRHAPIYLQPLE